MKLKKISRYIALGLATAIAFTSGDFGSLNIGILRADAASVSTDGYKGSFSGSVTAACPGYYEAYNLVDAVDGDDCHNGTSHRSACVPNTTTGSCDRGNGSGQEVNGWVLRRHICWDDAPGCPITESDSWGASCAHRYGYAETECNVCHSRRQSKSPSASCPNRSNGHWYNHAGADGMAECGNCHQAASGWSGKCNNAVSFEISGSWNNVVTYQMDNVSRSKTCTPSDNRVTVDYDSSLKITYNFSTDTNGTRICGYQWYMSKPTEGDSYDDWTAMSFSMPVNSDYNWHNISLPLSNVKESGIRYKLKFYIYGHGWVETAPIYIDTTIVYFDYSPDDGVTGNETKYNLGTLLDRNRTPNTSIKAYKPLIPNTPYGELPGDTNSKFDDKDSDGNGIVENQSLYMYYNITLYPRGKADGVAKNNYSVLMPGSSAYNSAKVYYNGSEVDVSGRDNFLGNVYDFTNSNTTKTHTSTDAVGINEVNSASERWSYNIYSFHQFMGWFLSKSYEESTRITADTLVTVKGKHWAYAKWNHDIPTDVQLPIPKREFTISLDSEGGQIIEGSDKTLDDIKYYFSFDGWGIAPDTSSITKDTVVNDAEKHQHSGDLINGGECYQTPVYHKHVGSAKDGTGCYTVPVPHTHTGSSTEGTGCYTIPVYHVCSGDEENGGACYSPIYHQHTSLNSDGTSTVRSSNFTTTIKGDCFETPVYHYHTGNSSSGGGCYTKAHMVWTVVGSESGRCGGSIELGSSDYTGGWGSYGICQSCGDVYGVDQIGNRCWNTVSKPKYGWKQQGWELNCGKTAGATIEYYKLSCTKTNTTIDRYKLSCNKFIDHYDIDCGLDNSASSYNLGCGMTESTIIGYKLSCTKDEYIQNSSLLDDNIISTSEILELGNNYQPTGDTTLYAQWSRTAERIELPQVYKPGYVFLGWYTVPQSHIYPDVPTGGKDGTSAVYGDTYDDYYYTGFYAGGGYDPTKQGTDAYAKDCKFREESVNMDNSSNHATLYAWFNRKPMFADVYEGLFFEGQAVSLKDLTRLVSVFDYEDDYYNEAVKKIYNLPEVDLDDIYLPVIIEEDDDYKEGDRDEDNSKDSDLSTSNPDDDSYYDKDSELTQKTYFDYSRWEKVTSLSSTPKTYEDSASVTDPTTNYGVDENTLGKTNNPDGSDTLSIIQANEAPKVDIIDGMIVVPKTITVTRQDGSQKTYNAGEKIDGVYRCIDPDDEDFNGKVFFTVEAKECLEEFIKGTSLDLRIKSITYHVKDGVELAEPQVIDFQSLSSSQYADFVNVTEVVPTTEKDGSGNVTKADAWKTITYKRPMYGLDTSTSRIVRTAVDAEGLPDTRNWYGDFEVTYQVTDNGILCGNTILSNPSGTNVDGTPIENVADTPNNDGSPAGIPNSAITIEYTRNCRIQYNDTPLMYMSNMTLLNDFPLNLDEFKKQLVANQVVIDAQDSQTNVPWWTKTKSLKELNESIEIVGVCDIEVNAGLAKELNKTGAELTEYLNSKIHTLEELYTYKNADPASDEFKMYRAITSFDVVYNAHDQFGKYVDGSVTPTRKTTTLKAGADGVKTEYGDLTYDEGDYQPVDVSDEKTCKYEVDKVTDNRLRQSTEFLKTTVYLIDIFADDSMVSANVQEEIRFISGSYINFLKSSGSYFGTAGYGLEKLESVLALKESGSVKNTTTTTYTTGLGNKVNVTVNDYTE